MQMKRRNSRLGFSLLEVLIALAILGIGSMLCLKLIGVFINTNKGLSSNQEAVALATRLMSEIMDAQYRSAADFDPGLAISASAYAAPVPGSTIVSVGDFLSESYTPLGGGAPPTGLLAKFTARYIVSDCASCTTPVPGNPGLVGAGGIEVFVEVANAEPDGPLFQPIRMAVRRTYSSALVCAAVAPGDPCAVRGYN
jgi:prepilin-type N-terminal cleavage/methylation domain-containing protein